MWHICYLLCCRYGFKTDGLKRDGWSSYQLWEPGGTFSARQGWGGPSDLERSTTLLKWWDRALTTHLEVSSHETLERVVWERDRRWKTGGLVATYATIIYYLSEWQCIGRWLPLNVNLKTAHLDGDYREQMITVQAQLPDADIWTRRVIVYKRRTYVDDWAINWTILGLLGHTETAQELLQSCQR